MSFDESKAVLNCQRTTKLKQQLLNLKEVLDLMLKKELINTKKN